MPKVKPLTKEQQERQAEEAASKIFIRKLNMIKFGVGAETDEDFAEMIGITYARYRNIKRNPMSVRIRELMKILSLSESCGMIMIMGADGQLEAKA